MRSQYTLTFIFSLFMSVCQAQIDTEFWFAPPDATSGHGESPIYLRFSALDKDAHVRVLQPAHDNLELANIIVNANSTGTVNLSSHIDEIETNVPASVMKTGIRIVSSTPVTAYYEIGSTWNADIFALKGSNALGNRFIIPAQNLYNNSSEYFPIPNSSFDVVAVSDNTVVRVRPSKPLFGREGDSLIVVKLNAGETYSFRKNGLLATDNPSGTIVESSRPIAITIKDDSVINGFCRDLLGDQLVPVKVAGSEYVILRGFLNTPEYLFVTATEDNTKLFIGGSDSPVATLATGEVYRHAVTAKSTYIVADKTIYVFHVTGFGCELGLAILPSITCKGSEQIGFSRTTSDFFGLNILVRKEGISHFRINGSPSLVQASQFSPVPGTNDRWYTAQVSFGTSQIRVGQSSIISNTQQSFQLGIINGDANTTCRYGYFSAFSSLFIGDDFTICDGETAVIDAGPGKETYHWSTGATSQSIVVDVSGTYSVKVEKEDCILYDTVKVDVRKGLVDLGANVDLCEGDSVSFDGGENFSWQWTDGSTDRYITADKPGKYGVSVRDYNGCPATDTVVVDWFKDVFDETLKVTLNYASVDTVNEETINLSWTIPENERKDANTITVHESVRGEEGRRGTWTFPATISSFINPGRATENDVYEYFVMLSNKCNSEQRSSDIHNTIVLTGVADTVTDVISFAWNHYNGWDTGVSYYELWRKVDDELGYRFIDQIPGSDNTFTSVIASDGFDHTYLIRAVGTPGINESWSNNVSFFFDHPLFIPNFISPNGDPYNQNFYIDKIQLYKHAELVITDRWGRPVFQTKGYQNDWDGKGLSSGVYYYTLHLKRNNKIHKGTLSIQR